MSPSLPLAAFAVLVLLSACLASPAPTEPTLIADVAQPDAVEGLGVQVPPTADAEPDPTRQLSPSTQSFLATLGTALGPIIGAIVGPLLSNIGQNLAAGSGAQAISQLQQAAQAAIQQQQQLQAGIAASSETVVTLENSTASTSTTIGVTGAGGVASSVSVIPPPPGRPGRPPGPPTRPGRPASSPSTPVTTGPAPGAPNTARPALDAFVVDVPGKGPVLLMLPASASAAEQAVAIEQAKTQAAQLLSQAQSGGATPLASLLSSASASSTPRPQVTKPTSVGPLPVRPAVTPTPLPSYHALPLLGVDDDLDQQGDEEVARPEHVEGISEKRVPHEIDDDHDFSPQSLLARLFPEMI